MTKSSSSRIQSTQVRFTFYITTPYNKADIDSRLKVAVTCPRAASQHGLNLLVIVMLMHLEESLVEGEVLELEAKAMAGDWADSLAARVSFGVGAGILAVRSELYLAWSSREQSRMCYDGPFERVCARRGY